MFIIQEEISNSKYLEDVSNAGGDDRPARNALCRTRCNLKRKSKREECYKDCDKQFPPSEKQEDRRDERDTRQDARQDKRKTVDECKSAHSRGEIDKNELKTCIKDARKEKRETIKEEGGGKFFTRMGRGYTKINPITATSRGGAILLIKQNTLGFATRLAPALVSDAEANKKFTPESISLAKKGWEKVKKTWRNAGGNEFKLRDAILEGYKKKPEKLPRKASSFSGREEYSNVVDWAVVSSVAAMGLGLLQGLVKLIQSIGVKKNPYKQGELPPEYASGLNTGVIDEEIPTDPDSPTVDPKTGKWVDPKTGKEVNPQTGEQLILGMNPYLAIGLGVVIVTSGIIITYKLIKK